MGFKVQVFENGTVTISVKTAKTVHFCKTAGLAHIIQNLYLFLWVRVNGEHFDNVVVCP